MEREKSNKQRRNRSGIIGTILLGILGVFGGVFQDFTSAILEPILVPLESKWARIIQTHIPQEEELPEQDNEIPIRPSNSELLPEEDLSTPQAAVEESQQSFDGIETSDLNRSLVIPSEQGNTPLFERPQV